MPELRLEHDLLGECNVPADALYGVYTVRALDNFPLGRRPVHPALIHGYGAVKLACARTNHGLGAWDQAKAEAIERACRELADGSLDGHIVVDALQGGALLPFVGPGHRGTFRSRGRRWWHASRAMSRRTR